MKVNKIDWKIEKEKLSQMINDKIPYEKIGRIYNVTGNAVKKAAKRLGIILEQRRNINPSESFNKGKIKTHFCKNCGCEFNHKHSSSNNFVIKNVKKSIDIKFILSSGKIKKKMEQRDIVKYLHM